MKKIIGEVNLILLQTLKGRMKRKTFTTVPHIRVKMTHTTITNIPMCQMKIVTKVWIHDTIKQYSYMNVIVFVVYMYQYGLYKRYLKQLSNQYVDKLTS